jgi:hypothetical protein
MVRIFPLRELYYDFVDKIIGGKGYKMVIYNQKC